MIAGALMVYREGRKGRKGTLCSTTSFLATFASFASLAVKSFELAGRDGHRKAINHKVYVFGWETWR